jgi:hypothetical protein
LSNPANKAGVEEVDRKAKAPVSGKVQAHPIIGWKGFEDVVGSIPGKPLISLRRAGKLRRQRLPLGPYVSFLFQGEMRSLNRLFHSASPRSIYDNRGVFPWRLHIYRACCYKMDS